MILGIDFGTCFSSVAVMHQGSAVTEGILPREKENKGIPTLFAVYNGKKKFGEECNKYYGITAIVKNLKLKMRLSSDGTNPLNGFEVIDLHDTRNTMQRREILKEYITYLLGQALEGIRLKGKIEKINVLESVAVTIPVGLDKNATFKADYSRAVKDAVIAAAGAYNLKLEPEKVCVVEEPVAAAMSYFESFYGKMESSSQTILVLDIGGGTTDVAIVECDRNTQQYLYMGESKGDLNLGGNNWDEALKKLVLAKFHKENAPALKNERMVNALDVAINALKHDLTSYTESEIALPWDNFDTKEITRKEFEEATKGLLKKVQDLVRNTVQAYGKKIHKIVLVGGACNMPQIKRGLESVSELKGIKVHLVNPSKAIAEGAAFYATHGHQIVPVALATYGLDYTDRATGKPMVENVIFKGQQFGANGYLEGESQSYVATNAYTNTISSIIYESECRNVPGEIKVPADGSNGLRVNGKHIILEVPAAYLGRADHYHHKYKIRLYENGDLKIEIYERLVESSDNWTKVERSRITIQNEE